MRSRAPRRVLTFALRAAGGVSCMRCRHVRPVTPLPGVRGRGCCQECLDDPEGIRLWRATRCFRACERAGRADKRQRGFDLSIKLFLRLLDTPCHYCGSPVSGVALDRVNNDKGYTARNVVQACWTCNRAKGLLTARAFVAMCAKVARHRRGKKI